ncbi:DUF4437 domain-containing protein [Lujinxingia sediminis]|uniref:DUF4437 domain-containing protein n=1 Tax=Lujinxingia sediminis TaxID=2480984 RepID=A0ABY0CQN1_9DELT|nr:cupin domain-containing protein [Lujinxingia sediminis]RVU42365.1 DUF4437 domain-containing protein [Lujinxingia sediminis]
MRLNDDFARRTLVHASQQPWVPSPAAGVERRMIFRRGAEKARATSIVRYAPGSAFPSHVHTGGEEFLVLVGVFQDDAGDYPAGSYVRNPPGSSHAPAAKDGAIIFVRLWQFRADDTTHVVRLPGEGQQVAPRHEGGSARVLFEDEHEQVRLETWAPHTEVAIDHPDGLELLVISGQLHLSEGPVTAQGWLRLPAGEPLEARIGPEGAHVWMKLAPLLHANVSAFDDAPA